MTVRAGKQLARRATGGGAGFAAFQATSALLLLAAAASSYLAGSGLLKALALHVDGGLVARPFGVVNRYFVPPSGIALLMLIAALLIVLSGGLEQELVQFYAVAVFVSFLAAVVACAELARRERRPLQLALSAAGAAMVVLVLAVNLSRLDPLLSLAASAAISLYLWGVWVRRGRPRGIAEIRP